MEFKNLKAEAQITDNYAKHLLFRNLRADLMQKVFDNFKINTFTSTAEALQSVGQIINHFNWPEHVPSDPHSKNTISAQTHSNHIYTWEFPWKLMETEQLLKVSQVSYASIMAEQATLHGTVCP